MQERCLILYLQQFRGANFPLPHLQHTFLDTDAAQSIPAASAAQHRQLLGGERQQHGNLGRRTAPASSRKYKGNTGKQKLMVCCDRLACCLGEPSTEHNGTGGASALGMDPARAAADTCSISSSPTWIWICRDGESWWDSCPSPPNLHRGISTCLQKSLGAETGRAGAALGCARGSVPIFKGTPGRGLQERARHSSSTLRGETSRKRKPRRSDMPSCHRG